MRETRTAAQTYGCAMIEELANGPDFGSHTAALDDTRIALVKEGAGYIDIGREPAPTTRETS
jgi:hypothetical protein